MLADFQEYHAKGLDQLRGLYGSSNVTVKWGMVHGEREYLTGMPADSELRKTVHSILYKHRQRSRGQGKSKLKPLPSDTGLEPHGIQL